LCEDCGREDEDCGGLQGAAEQACDELVHAVDLCLGPNIGRYFILDGNFCLN
jgi:hypothetical protein